jgi:hypothetical protein
MKRYRALAAEAGDVLLGVFERHFGDWESPPEQDVPPVEPLSLE